MKTPSKHQRAAPPAEAPADESSPARRQAAAPARKPAPAAAREPSAARMEAPAPDGVRDTIESVVVALILAFVFRAFIVEAFVIPTGSMAPSLYGKHGQHRCRACGYSFAYGIREPMTDPANNPIAGTLVENGRLRRITLRCPNCSWDGPGNSDLNSRPDERIVADSGDRILVLKWPYDIGGDWLGPKRWDVVVFKNPQDGKMNFIKRLLGLPGEVLEIIDGDVYTAPLSSVPDDIVHALSGPPPAHRPEARRLTEAQSEALARVLSIRRKTPVAQSSLWMLHYDHDYIPRPPARGGFDPPRWVESGPGPTAWNASTPLVRFEPVDDREHWLRLAGRPIQDEYGYNNVNLPLGARDLTRDVGDVRLKFVLFPGEGKGRITLRLRKGADRFQVHLSTDGSIRLERLQPPGKDGLWVELRRRDAFAPLMRREPLEIEFENLDYRVALRINGEEILRTEDADYRPDLHKLLRRPYEDGRGHRAGVAIGAVGLPLEIRHLQVHRDVYYRSPRIDDRRRAGTFNDYPGWGTATNPILLRAQPPDFFCCGDNSPQSKDSRLWIDVCRMLRDRQAPNDYQYGTVPGDQLIGRAFFVYWPSGLRFSRDTWPLIPNVGRMRIIR